MACSFRLLWVLVGTDLQIGLPRLPLLDRELPSRPRTSTQLSTLSYALFRPPQSFPSFLILPLSVQNHSRCTGFTALAPVARPFHCCAWQFRSLGVCQQTQDTAPLIHKTYADCISVTATRRV